MPSEDAEKSAVVHINKLEYACVSLYLACIETKYKLSLVRTKMDV